MSAVRQKSKVHVLKAETPASNVEVKPTEYLQASFDIEQQNDGNMVSFTGPNDPLNPINWSRRYKRSIIGLISAMNLVITLATLICAPAVPLILSTFSSNNQSYTTILVSIWELGEACGPLLVAPMSEVFGRAPIYHTANVLFVLFSVGGALSSNIQMLVAFRFLSGLTVASVTLDPSVVGDMFVVEERGRAMAIANLAPLIGPIAGPIIGGYMSQAIGCRWIFWLPALLGGIVKLGFVLLFRETYKVRIIQQKVRRLKKQTTNTSLQSAYVEPRPKDILTKSLVRPMRMLILSPVLCSMAVYVAMVFGYLYMLLTSITETFKTIYGFSTGSASVIFVGLGIGMTTGVFLCQITLDSFLKKWTGTENMEPEHRLPPMIVGGFVIPLSLFLYGWTVHYKVYWVAPSVGLVLLGFGVVITFIPAFSYLVDAFGAHAASAIAASITLRCVTGAILPLAEPSLYGNLGQGWGNSVLGLIAFAFLPVPLLLMKYGKSLRQSSKLQVIH